MKSVEITRFHARNSVIPAKAIARLSMRLVPDQTPEQVHRSLKKYLTENTPETVVWELKQLPGCRPAIMNRDTKEMGAASQALEAVWGRAPIFLREGGSNPIHGFVEEYLDVPSVSLGFILPDDNIHAPNERHNLLVFYKAVESYIRFLHLVAEE